MTIFTHKGNLGSSPTLKRVTHKGREMTVAEMRVFFGRYKVNDDNDEIEQVGGYWLPVSLYGVKGEAAARHLRKGARVQVCGELREFYAKEDEAKDHPLFQIVAEDVLPVLTRIESITFKQRNPAEEPAAA